MPLIPCEARGRIESDPAVYRTWSLSPDGSRLAVPGADPREGSIKLLSTTGGPASDLIVKRWGGVSEVDWAPDGKSLVCGMCHASRRSTSSCRPERPRRPSVAAEG